MDQTLDWLAEVHHEKNDESIATTTTESAVSNMICFIENLQFSSKGNVFDHMHVYI